MRALSMLALVLAGCSAGPMALRPTEVQGIINDIDFANRKLVVVGGGMRSELAFDTGTAVLDEGQRLAITELRQGDEVAVRYSVYQGRYIADQIRVVRRGGRE